MNYRRVKAEALRMGDTIMMWDPLTGDMSTQVLGVRKTYDTPKLGYFEFEMRNGDRLGFNVGMEAMLVDA